MPSREGPSREGPSREEPSREEPNREELTRATELAIAGEWAAAHAIVQQHEADATSCWIHAVLHKIEGDTGNSRYWYRRAGRSYEAYPDAAAELAAIKASLTY